MGKITKHSNFSETFIIFFIAVYRFWAVERFVDEQLISFKALSIYKWSNHLNWLKWTFCKFQDQWTVYQL